MGGFNTSVMPPSTAALDLRPPQSTDPLATLAQMSQLQAQRQEIQQRAALAPVQLGTAQLQQQQLQQQITSQRAIADALKNWDPNTPVTSILPDAIKNGAMGNDVLAFQQHIAEMRQKNAAASKEELDTSLKKHDELRGTVDSIIKADPGAKQGLWTNYLPRMESELDPSDPRLPAIYPGDDLAAVISKSHAAASALSKEALEGAQAGAQTAEAKVKNLQAQVEQEQLNHYRTLTQSPEALSAYVARSINPQQYPQEFQAALSEAQQQGSLKDLNAVIEKHGQNIREREKTIGVETSPQVRAARTQQALDIATATNPLKLQEARASAMATSGVREALTIDQQYAKAASATEALGRVLDAADTGNKAAGSALPVLSAEGMNAIFGIKRINKFDIDQAGGLQAGNLWDRIVGWADKATIGQPIPQNIRDDIRSLHQTLGENGYNQYTTSLNALSQRTGTDYKPTIQAPNIRKAPSGTYRMTATGPGGHKIGSNDNGQTWVDVQSGKKVQ